VGVRLGDFGLACEPDMKSTRPMASGFLDFIRLVVDGNVDEVSRRLVRSGALASTPADVGATRQEASTFFYADIAHYLYAGDTALHMAAAAFRRRIAEVLIEHGAPCRAKNRRGAEPLHYAADGNRWDPTGQVETIEFLVSVGADPNAVDRSGVAPLHRAVRTRSLAAVRALLDGGANARQRNTSGSTPLHLAVQTTGRGGSGSPRAREQQAGIVRLLLERGARATDRDGHGRGVDQAATSEWIKALLREASAG
jgi:ankyrin repeat protein